MGRSGRALELVGKKDLAVMLLLKFLAHICQDLSSPEIKKKKSGSLVIMGILMENVNLKDF